MQFNTLIELADYLLNNDLKVSDLGIITNHNNDNKEVIADTGEEAEADIDTDSDVELKDNEITESMVTEAPFTNFISKPRIPVNIVNEGSNVLTVKSVEVFKDACGTGSLEIGDTKTLMNVCESDGKITANLSFILENVEHKNVEFEIEVGETENAKINKNNIK